MLTNFNGTGVGFGFGVGCGFGIGWGFGVRILEHVFSTFLVSRRPSCVHRCVCLVLNGMPLHILGLGVGGGCGVGLGLGWGFGTAFGSHYRTAEVKFQGFDFNSKGQSGGREVKDPAKQAGEIRASQ